jgi:preprotein translocase subunit YajC
MTDRDKKIMMLIVPLALIAAFWFLVYSPKSKEVASAQSALETAQSDQQTAEAQAATVSSAKDGFADDYTTVIRLGKAVPANVDMPSLIVQLDRAARGTHISFDKISTGPRATAVAAAAATDTTTSTSIKASGPGKTAQNAQNGVNSANATNQANANAANGSTPASGTGTTPAGSGLESVPLDFTFTGTFFDLSDFLHRMKRFVKVVNDDIVVRGRLMTIDSFNFTADQTFPQLKAEVHATVYLAPKTEGVNAGATSSGPAPATTPSASGTTTTTPPATTTPPSPATTAPAATVK